MIGFSNTTPFIALSCINHLELLPKIFEKVHVAQAVVDECAQGGPIFVPSLPALPWVIPVADLRNSTISMIFELDRGEKQTILLARQFNADKGTQNRGLAFNGGTKPRTSSVTQKTFYSTNLTLLLAGFVGFFALASLRPCAI